MKRLQSHKISNAFAPWGNLRPFLLEGHGCSLQQFKPLLPRATWLTLGEKGLSCPKE
jgi:hypothetical protein